MKVTLTKGDFIVVQTFVSQLSNNIRFGHPAVSDLREVSLIEWDAFQKMHNYQSPKGHLKAYATNDAVVLEITEEGMRTMAILINPTMLGIFIQKSMDLTNFAQAYVEQVMSYKAEV